jgi:hypothetical protein
MLVSAKRVNATNHGIKKITFRDAPKLSSTVMEKNMANFIHFVTDIINLMFIIFMQILNSESFSSFEISLTLAL